MISRKWIAVLVFTCFVLSAQGGLFTDLYDTTSTITGLNTGTPDRTFGEVKVTSYNDTGAWQTQVVTTDGGPQLTAQNGPGVPFGC